MKDAGQGRAFPFAVDRLSPTNLVEQVENGFRDAIAHGVYRIGDALPTWRESMCALGVSDRVLREAMARLVRQGLVVSHGRSGCRVVSEKVLREWKAVVLCVQDMHSALTYSTTAEEFQLARTLAHAGMAFIPVTVDTLAIGRSVADFALIERVLAFKADFILMPCVSVRLARLLSRQDIPFASCEDLSLPNFVGRFPNYDFSRAISKFVSRCRANRVKRVLQVSFTGSELFDAVPALRDVGIAADRWVVPCADASVGGVRAAAERAFTKRLEKGRDWLPDVLLFVDDYVATGALTALSCAGVRIPQDVQVVTFANKGNEPAFPIRLTSIGLDSARSGRMIAESVIAYRKTGKWPAGRKLRASYVEGDTFPRKTVVMKRHGGKQQTKKENICT